jgi:hypothetical protein
MKKLFLISIMLIYTLGAYAQNAPIASLAGKSEGKISVDEIIQAAKITVSDTSCVIAKYILTMHAGGDLVSMTSDSDLITEIMIKQLKQAKEGQKIYFEDIQIKKPDGSIAKLSPLIFVIK